MTASLRRHRHLVPLCCVVALTAFVVACSQESGTQPPPPPGLTVNQLVETTGWFPAVATDSTAFTQARFDSTGTDGGLACAEYAGHEQRAVTRLTILEPSASVHRAGSILQYASIDRPQPDLVTAPRAGGEVQLAVAGGAVVSGTLTVLDADSVEAWRQATVATAGGGAPVWELEVSAIRDAPQMPLAAGVFPSAFPAAVAAQLAPRSPEHGAALVRLQRTHHTVSSPYPGRAGNAFAPGVMGDDLDDQMAEGNPPIWLGGVEYGQLVLVLVEADADFATVVDACINTFVAAATAQPADGARPTLADLPALSVAAYAVAADAAAVESAALADLATLASVLATPIDQPADLPPITADLYALRSGGPVVLGPEADFSFVACEHYEAVFDEVIWSLDAADARTERQRGDLQSNGGGYFYYNGGSYAFEYDHVVAVPDFRGQGAASVPDRFGADPILYHHLIGGRPALEVYEFGLPDGDVYSQMNIDGAPFVGREYTLFMVIGIPAIIRLTVVADPENVVISRANDLGWIMHGGEDGSRNNLAIGYNSRTMTYRHGQYSLTFTHDIPQDWHVYAFRFGLASGMTVFMDGERLGQIDWDYSLLSFGGARICARWRGLTAPSHAVLWLAEAVAYRGSGSDEDVLAETARLRQKYGF
ncbi:MAG: hypothetical protein R3D98_17150 [Candidatus Krumholzibacteriia bacterium]